MRPIGTSKLLEVRRKKAIRFLESGWQPVEVARLLGVDRRSVRRWKAAYQKAGIGAIKARSSTGRPSRLNGELKAKISQMLSKGPNAVGLPVRGWTYSQIAKAIQKEFGISYHRNYIGPLLRSNGLVRK